MTLHLLTELQLRRLGELTRNTYTKSIGSQRWRHSLLLLAHTKLKCLQPGIVAFTSSIRACKQQWEECAGLLNEIGQEGLEKDIILLSAASSAIGSAKWQAAVTCVRTAGTLRLQADAQSCSLGISACATVVQWREALALLQDLRRGLQADAVAFNGAICSCQNTGNWQQALCLLVVMEKMGLPEVISFCSTMGACIQAAREWGRALVLLQMLVDHGMQPTQIMCNTVVGALEWHGAWQMLADLRKRRSFDVITTNATSRACARAGAWRQAFFIVQYMGEAHVKRDAITLKTSQTVCRKALLWQRSLEEGLLGLGSQKGAIETWKQALSACGTWAAALTHAEADTDVALGTAIGFCAKGSEWSRALEFLRGARILAVVVNEIMLNSGIHACQRAGHGHQWPAALNLFSAMTACRVSWDEATCVSLIASEDGQWMRSLRCLNHFEMCARHGSITAFNAAVGALAACGEWCRAVSLLKATAGRLRANEVTFNTLISCQRRARWQLAFSILRSLPQRSLLASLPAYSACGRVGDWQWGMLMLDELDASRIKTDSIAFNAVISTCEKASDWQRGLSILDLMTSRSIEASVVTYNSAMSACGKAEKSQVVLELLRHLEDSSMLVDVVSYNVAMSALGLAGRWRRALRMLAALSQPTRPQPSAASFGAAVSACAIAAKWKQSLLLFIEANSRSLSTVITLSAALSACVRAQQWSWSLWLLEVAERCKTSPDIVTCIPAVAACAAGNRRHATVLMLATLTSRTHEHLRRKLPAVPVWPLACGAGLGASSIRGVQACPSIRPVTCLERCAEATPAPPVGPAIGAFGLNIAMFVKVLIAVELLSSLLFLERSTML